MTDVPGALVERRGDVLVITINRPDARNAINAAVSVGVGDALDEAQKRPRRARGSAHWRRRQVVLCRRDLKAIARRESIYHPDHGEWGFAVTSSISSISPRSPRSTAPRWVGGPSLALASDLVVADERAKFGLPEVKRGLVAAAGGVFRIMDHLPRKVAMELLLTGEPLTAPTPWNGA